MRFITSTAAAPVKVEEKAVESPPEASLIPLLLVAAELSELGLDDVDRLADYLGDDVQVVAGLVRCASRSTVRRLADELEQARAAREEIQRRNREHMAEVAAAQAPTLRGRPVPAGLAELSALDVMKAGEYMDRLDHAGYMREVFTSGGDGLVYHSLEGIDAAEEE
jgi:hypothetical protein